MVVEFDPELPENLPPGTYKTTVREAFWEDGEPHIILELNGLLEENEISLFKVVKE